MSDVIIGAKLEADASGAINSVKNFKQELRLAQQEVVTLSEKFGATSKEAAAAAMRAAELKDKIGDAASLVDAFNPDTKFRAFGASIQTVVGGFTALTGAMGLLGVESEEVQKTLLKVQSALALSQGIAQLQEGMQAMKNLGAVLVNTLGKSGLMGIAIAGVAALGLALSGVFKRNQELIKSNEAYAKGLADARVEMVKLRASIDQAKSGVISKQQALKNFNSTLGQVVGETNNLNVAEKLYVLNADKYVKIQGLKAKANYLLEESAKASAQAEITRMAAEKGDFRGSLGDLIAQAEAQAARYEKRVKELNEEIKTLQGTLTLSIGGNIGTTGAKDANKTPSTPKEAEEQYEFIEGTIKKKNDLELTGLQESLKNRFDATEKAKELQAKQYSDTEFYQWAQVKLEENTSAARLTIAENEANQKKMFWQSTASVLGALGDLVGRQTAAGKVLAIAEATINTYLAATNILKTTAKTPAGGIPGFAIAQMAATIIAGLAAVRNIAKVQVPGGGGSGGGGVSAPLIPRVPQSTGTRLDRDQLNQIGNAAVRAFVVESDISTSQSRIRRLNRAARI